MDIMQLCVEAETLEIAQDMLWQPVAGPCKQFAADLCNASEYLLVSIGQLQQVSEKGGNQTVSCKHIVE